VLTWRDCLEYSPAWDTLIWFAILISMSNGLNESGLINTFAGIVGQQLTALNLGWEVRSLWTTAADASGRAPAFQTRVQQ
jgi:DASS family divalent anion:Na+ symporter